MMASPPRLMLLSRMEEAHRQTRRQLDMIDRQIIRRMTALIPQLGRKRSKYHRGKASDPRAFLERYRSNLAAITAERQPEIDALSRKLDRQDAAIEALRARYAPAPGHVRDNLEDGDRTQERRSPAEHRPGKRHGAAAAVWQGESFWHRQPGPHPIGSRLGFAAVCAPGGPLQGQVASDRCPPISARPGRVRRRAPAGWSPACPQPDLARLAVPGP